MSDIQQQLERCEQDKAALKLNMDKLTQEGKTQQAELEKKAQSLATELQKAQQEKEAQRKECATTQESLGKANKALKESQSQLDTERKNHKSAMEEKVVSLCYRDKQFKLIQHHFCIYFFFIRSLLTVLIFLNPQEKSSEKARQELLKTNEATTKEMKDCKEQMEQMKEVNF